MQCSSTFHHQNVGRFVGPQSAQVQTGWAMLIRGRSLLGQSSRYLTMMTRPVLTKLFRAWSVIVVRIPVYDIIMSSQSRHSPDPNRHAMNYWFAYTMTDTYLLSPIAMKFRRDWENLSNLKIRKFHLNPSNFTRELMMMFKLDLNKLRLPHSDPGAKRVNAKSQYILRRKWPLACISCTHQKSYKLDRGITLIFVSEKSAITFGEGCISLWRDSICGHQNKYTCADRLCWLLHKPPTRYVKLRVAHAPVMPRTFSPSPTSKETTS